MKQWILSNTGLKLVALGLALFVWFFVRAITSDSRSVEGVPIEVKPPAGYTVRLLSPRSLTVTVRGTTEDLRLASRNEIFAVIDLPDPSATNVLRVPVTPRDIHHPPRVQVVGLEPTNVVVQLRRASD